MNSELSDLWKYSPATGTWAWMSGSNVMGQAPQDHSPWGRFSAFSWTDASGNLWLFGGEYAGNGTETANDLWVYTPQ